MNKPKVVVVMPAYNAARTIQKTYKDIPQGIVDEVIVVDDASSDETTNIAKALGTQVRVVRHTANVGYGGNQKTCYREALKSNADIVVMLHPDYQYPPKLLKYLVVPVADGSFDIMLGSRIQSRVQTLKLGMPLYKYLGNRVLTFLENIVLGLNMSEYHTGYRAFSSKALKQLPIHAFSNDFIFDQEIIIAAHMAGFSIGEVFTPASYRQDSSSISFKRSVIYGWGVLWLLFMYLVNRKVLFTKNT